MYTDISDSASEDPPVPSVRQQPTLQLKDLDPVVYVPRTATGRSPQASRLKWKPTPLASHLTTNQFRSETERLGLLNRLARNGCECLSRQMKAVAQLHWRDPEPVSCNSEGACQPFRSNELGLAAVRFAAIL